MMHKNIITGELIGLKVEVINSSNHSTNNIKGDVVDETKNTLVILCGKQKKKIMKQCSDFVFHKNGKKYLVKGSILAKKPEDRIKIK